MICITMHVACVHDCYACIYMAMCVGGVYVPHVQCVYCALQPMKSIIKEWGASVAASM